MTVTVITTVDKTNRRTFIFCENDPGIFHNIARAHVCASVSYCFVEGYVDRWIGRLVDRSMIGQGFFYINGQILETKLICHPFFER